MEVNVNDALPAGVYGTLWFAGVTVSVGVAPAWVTVTVAVGAPEAVAVIVATLGVIRVLTGYVAVIVPFPLPESVTVHQLWLLDAFQDVLEVTVNAVEPAGVAGTF